MLTDLATVKSFMQIAPGDTSSDGVISLVLPAVEQRATKIMQGRIIEAADYEAIFDGHGVPELRLPHYPINSLAGVWIDPDNQWGDETALDLANIRIDNEAGILIREGAFAYQDPLVNYFADIWTPGRRNIKVAWNGGFTAIPADLMLAATVTAADWVRRSDQLGSGQGVGEIQQEQIVGARMETYFQESTEFSVPKLALGIFQSYAPTM